ncbi:hypothetical protein JZ751_009632, partial [Albula glossodonta]
VFFTRPQNQGHIIVKMLHPRLFLLLLCCAAGSLAVQWSISVPAQVNGTKGQNVVLPCSFTHPQQQHFTGEILVKWIIGTFKGNTIFQCSVMNSTARGLDQCSVRNVTRRYSLQGNPRDRDLSLHIQGLEFSDINQYFCRVELDRTKKTMYQTKTGTQLNVTAVPEILSLIQVAGPPPSNTSLECVAEGNPRPTLTFLSLSGPAAPALTSPVTSHFRVTLRIPISSRDIYVCRATNLHGTVERVFPSRQGPSAHTLASCISGALLLLGLGLLFFWLRQRGQAQASVMSQDQDVCYTEVTFR